MSDDALDKVLRRIAQSRIVIDEDCPACGWPERWAILPASGPGPLFGCPKCDYTSGQRES